MTESERITEIDDLLIGFDELGFRPTIPLPDPEATAVRWRNKLVNALKDYRKVERGSWERVGKNRFKCTACKSVLYLFAKFCPECGADMRSNKDDKKERINYYD